MININLPFHIILRAKPETLVLCAAFAAVVIITTVFLLIPDEKYEEYIFGKEE